MLYQLSYGPRMRCGRKLPSPPFAWKAHRFATAAARLGANVVKKLVPKNFWLASAGDWVVVLADGEAAAVAAVSEPAGALRAGLCQRDMVIV